MANSRILDLDRSAGVVFAGLLAAATALSALPVKAADRFEPAGDGWQFYVNERFGTSLAFPADVFAPDEPPEGGDGRRFLADDATMEVFAWDNLQGESAASLQQRLVGSEGYADVTYSPSGQGWLVLSGYRGDTIFYEKYFFHSGTVHGFGIEFPAAEKPRYAPIIERVEDSFRAG